MKAIKFVRSKDNDNHYLPLTTDLSDWDKDHSGTYYPAAPVERLVKALRKISKLKLGNYAHEDFYLAVDIAEVALAALEAKDG
jgi:hypothetical protein